MAIRFELTVLMLVARASVAAEEATPVTFVSTGAGGQWSALETWRTKDGAAAPRVPAAGDAVVIAGVVTVDKPVTVGDGIEEALTFEPGAKLGDTKLIVAAPLTVRGNVLCRSNCVIEVQAGQGIELDGQAEATPLITAPLGEAIHVYFQGTAEKRCYLRTKARSAGNPGMLRPDRGPSCVAASYTDFTDLGRADPQWQPANESWGLRILPTKETLAATLAHCRFTRTNLLFALQDAAGYSLSDCVFTDTPIVHFGERALSVQLMGGGKLDIQACGLDGPVWLNGVREISSTVFLGNFVCSAEGIAPFASWSDNLSLVSDAAGGYIIPWASTYSRSYWICQATHDNPHVMGACGGATVFDQCIWDVPLAEGGIDDALMILGGDTDVTVRRCLSLPRLAGAHPKCGVSLGYVGGGPTSRARYQYNTVVLGQFSGINSDIGHGGHEDSIAELKNNIFCILDGVAGPGKVLNSDVKNVVSPANCDYNDLYNSEYGRCTVDGQLGAHDISADPKFVDPVRCLITFWREQTKAKAGAADQDLAASLQWIKDHPGKMPELVDYTFAGFVPTNPALKAASDPQGVTKGWIGAMEGWPQPAGTRTRRPPSAMPPGRRPSNAADTLASECGEGGRLAGLPRPPAPPSAAAVVGELQDRPSGARAQSGRVYVRAGVQ